MLTQPVKGLYTYSTLSDVFYTHPLIGIPVGDHVGAFGAVRKHHRHEGVDLYVPDGSEVFSMTHVGIIKAIIPFTGVGANSDWWNDTEAVVVKTLYGDILYGEIRVNSSLKVGDSVKQGDLLGHVTPVLKKDKDRPTSMLHLERYRNFTKPFEWTHDKSHRDMLESGLQDITYLLTHLVR